MGFAPHTRPRDRLVTFLERHGFRGRPSELAREIRVSGKVAENLLNGHWPSDTTMGAIARRFGQDVWKALFADDIHQALAELTAEERRLEQQLAAIRNRRRETEDADQSLQAGVAEDADERDPLTLDMFGDAP